jgi:hypothetical protein
MKYDMEWIKTKIIIWLDAHYSDACWANLVMWSTGIQTFKETFGIEGNWKHQSCSDEGGGAYCGKCRKTGRLKD